MNAHVVGSQLRCNACNQRIRTRLAGYFEPMYPFCPWCGSPITNDAERLRTCHDTEKREGYFRCSECGYEFSSWGGFGCDCGDDPDFAYCPSCGRRIVEVNR